jgi:hypothetical protein
MSLNHIRTSNNGYSLPRKFTGRIAADYLGSNIVSFTAVRGQDGSISMTIHQALTVNLVNNTVILNLIILSDVLGQDVDGDFSTILGSQQIVPVNIGGAIVNEIGALFVEPRNIPSTTAPFSVRRDNSVAFPNGNYQIFTPGTTIKWVNSLY